MSYCGTFFGYSTWHFFSGEKQLMSDIFFSKSPPFLKKWNCVKCCYFIDSQAQSEWIGVGFFFPPCTQITLSKKFRNYYFVLFFGGVSFLFHFIIEWKNGSATVVDDVGIFHQRLPSDIQHARGGRKDWPLHPFRAHKRLLLIASTLAGILIGYRAVYTHVIGRHV